MTRKRWKNKNIACFICKEGLKSPGAKEKYKEKYKGNPGDSNIHKYKFNGIFF